MDALINALINTAASAGGALLAVKMAYSGLREGIARVEHKVDEQGSKLSDLIASNERDHAEMEGKIDLVETRLEERTDALGHRIDSIASSPFIQLTPKPKRT